MAVFAAQRVSQSKVAEGEVLEYRMDNANFAEGEDTIAVTAASFDNLIESDPATASWQQQAAARGVVVPAARNQKPSACAGRFYGVFVGAGTFRFAPDLNLRYPESDAQTLADAVRLGAESLCGKGRVELITLTTNNPDPSRQPTKDNIRRAFETIAAKSTRKDLLFVYLSGHGATPADDRHAYFYLTQDARQVNVDLADRLRDTTTVSAAELVQWLTNPSLPDKQVLILDTCAAGAASTQLTALSSRARSLADDLKKAVDNWNLDTGTYILLGSASDRASYESDRFRHGLLTYALLHGMKGDALLDGIRLEAAHWIDTTIPAVEKYAQMIGRDQKPQKAVPSAAGGIPVGFLPETVRDQIVLAEPGAEILKLAVCLDEVAFVDRLRLGPLIRSELRALTGSGARGPAVTYDDNTTEASGGALTPQVRYRVEGAQLRLTIALLQGETPASQTSLTVPLTDLQAAAQRAAEALVALASGTVNAPQ
jgi:hypothetical protein